MTTENWIKRLPGLQVHAICVAYESGYGKGLQNDNAPNPYEELTPEWEAYQYGWSRGYVRNKENEQDADKTQ